MIDFLLWVILINFALRLFWRYLLPWLLKRFMRRMQQKFTDLGGGQPEQKKRKQEGEITIDHVPPAASKGGANGAEDDYVDFEEIKNNDPQ